MGYLVTFDLDADSDYTAAHKTLAALGMKDSLPDGTSLPRSTVYCPTPPPGEITCIVAALLTTKGIRVSRVAASKGAASAWATPGKPGPLVWTKL